MKIEINRCLDLRYKSKSNLYPVSIKIYCNRKYYYIKTGIYLSQIDYEELHTTKPKTTLKIHIKSIVEMESLITTYLEGNNAVEIDKVRDYINNANKAKFKVQTKTIINANNVFEWFDKKIALCKCNKQFGNAESYTSTKNVFKEYCKVPVISFNFFTVKCLKEIETNLMNKRQIELSTVGKHARNLRAVFNMALAENCISNKEYPFGRYKYVIPEVTKAKKSLTRKMLRDLINYSPQNFYEKRAISYFIFSYYGNGMNLKDMAYIKYKDWKNDVLYFYRKKTKNTTNKSKAIKVIVTEEMKAIINEFGNSVAEPDTYIFPIITAGIDEELINTKVHTRNRTINKTLKRISKKLCSGIIITLGMARHTFANALKQEGVSINFIQESLGHRSAITTEHYMSSFEDAISKEHIGKLKQYFKL